MNELLTVTVSLLLGVIYLLPLLIANYKVKHNRTAITVLNLLVGWIVIGWTIVLIWACCND